MRINQDNQIKLLIEQGKIENEYVKEPEPVRAAVVEEKKRFIVSFWQLCIAGGVFFTILNAGEQRLVWLGFSGTILALVLMSATMTLQGVIEVREIRKKGSEVEAQLLCVTDAMKGRKWLWYEFELEDGKHLCAGNQCITVSESEEQEIVGEKRSVWYAEGQYDTVADISYMRILKEYRVTIMSQIILAIISGVILWMAITMKN